MWTGRPPTSMVLALQLEEEYRLHENLGPKTASLGDNCLDKYPQAWAETRGIGEAKRVPPIVTTFKNCCHPYWDTPISYE